MYLVFSVLLVVAVALAFALHTYTRRKRLAARPFPAQWLSLLENNVALYGKLPEALRLELQSHIMVFLGEKSFEGCGGLEVTDEMRVTVAALACILLLNRPTRFYPELHAILIYPSAYVADAVHASDKVGLADQPEVHLGESWNNGTLVLSWCDVERTAHNVRDGHNLVLHEFAHQLDQEDGEGNGIPMIEQRSKFYHWAEVLNHEYQTLVEKTEKGKRDVLQAYGATNPAEFFAVATEAFFEKPTPLHHKHPELYEQLREFYKLDPESWK